MIDKLTAAERRHVEQYWQRKAIGMKPGYRIDNSKLYAGSPMHYYCHDCGIHTGTLPETHIERPPIQCDGCAWLHDHGLLPPPQVTDATPT